MFMHTSVKQTSLSETQETSSRGNCFNTEGRRIGGGVLATSRSEKYTLLQETRTENMPSAFPIHAG